MTEAFEGWGGRVSATGIRLQEARQLLLDALESYRLQDSEENLNAIVAWSCAYQRSLDEETLLRASLPLK